MPKFVITDDEINQVSSSREVANKAKDFKVKNKNLEICKHLISKASASSLEGDNKEIMKLTEIDHFLTAL